MQLKSFDTRTYSVSDFSEWYVNQQLVLSPEFQRRAVWTTKAKSYLIDTILRGKPMPKVLITQSLIDGRNLRTVVDGQQRLRAILEYMSDSFTVMRTHNREFAGVEYSNLPQAVKDDFLQYEIGVDVLFNTELGELLDIFSRLNTYSVKLNSTELLNASYLGAFKTASHSLGHRYAAYWKEAGVFSDAQLARMLEVDLASDLLGALIVGIASKKQIPAFYRDYDDDEATVDAAVERFTQTMSLVSEIYSPGDLRRSNFRRGLLFYSMFLAVAGLAFGCPEIPGVIPSLIDPSKARVILDDISAKFEAYNAAGSSRDTPPDWAEFMQDTRRATTDQVVRERRSSKIASQLKAAQLASPS
jgi:hypothetical protein